MNKFKEALDDVKLGNDLLEIDRFENMMEPYKAYRKNASTIRTALLIAQTVTQEPTFSIIAAGAKNHSNKGALAEVEDIFKAMINQMVKEIE